MRVAELVRRSAEGLHSYILPGDARARSVFHVPSLLRVVQRDLTMRRLLLT